MYEQPILASKPHHHRRRQRRIITALVSAITIATALWMRTPAPNHQAGEIKPATTQPGSKADDIPAEQLKQALLNAQPGMWVVTHDVDGDTIDVRQGSTKERVRLLGIDTPETHDPRKPVQCFGEAAAAHTKQLLEGKSVRLEADPQDSDRDKYHRLLRYVYLPDGTLVNATLIRDGYAFAYTIFPIAKLDEFRALEADARDANRGLWAGCNVNASSDIKQTTGSKP
jgi:micrococcal nuclease